jgi:hypothetical protein
MDRVRNAVAADRSLDKLEKWAVRLACPTLPRSNSTRAALIYQAFLETTSSVSSMVGFKPIFLTARLTEPAYFYIVSHSWLLTCGGPQV